MGDALVQYVVIREDLAKAQGWSVGAVIAQGCHAATAAVWENREDPLTQEYLHPDHIDRMHKVVLKIKNETALLKLSQQLSSVAVAHKLWLELPEKTPTALATKPVVKDDVAHHFKKVQLYRDLVASSRVHAPASETTGIEPSPESAT
ncbi:hypothetical protein DIPPA_31911 [Diplonema papillatum]|nr:hypothetical protein DIPPA_31911 [Diplonema papillatum]|eukprot:gene19680-30329_t